MEGMSHLGYATFGRGGLGSNSSRGFRVRSRRFSVRRLRAKFACLIRALSKWRYRCGGALRAFNRSICCRETRADSPYSSSSSSYSLKRTSSSRRSLVKDDASCRTYYYDSGVPESCMMRSFARSNSVYSEAIADCLEFIKRSSVSVDEYRFRPKIEIY